ncbi:MAG: DEAD/DEAH box helicase, partial [Novibacillus thermophilus]
MCVRIPKAKGLEEWLETLARDGSLRQQIVHWETIEAKEAATVPFPDSLHPKLVEALQKRGIHELYHHQETAFQTAVNGKSFVAVTPTASGKTLCYNLPVLQAIIQNPASRALYLFPTKALAQDQKHDINALIEKAGVDVKSYTYDGDTPSNIRQVIRKAGNVVMTNPDMLHAAILPHHTKWIALFENLDYVVIDELHTYRGVFGS